ncbi:MAG TPA: chorismate mutase [Bryobacteraceae bacterium]|nr:chorismate mutase [Bryobacteraceae bacterium]
MERDDEQRLQALAECRDRIDEVDLKILELLNERTRAVEQIGLIKQQMSMPIYEPKREEEVYRNIREHNQGPMPSDSVKRVFERIIDEMRQVQRLRMIQRNRDRESAAAPATLTPKTVPRPSGSGGDPGCSHNQ